LVLCIFLGRDIAPFFIVFSRPMRGSFRSYPAAAEILNEWNYHFNLRIYHHFNQRGDAYWSAA